jgi:hypothetical protein
LAFTLEPEGVAFFKAFPRADRRELIICWRKP